MKLNYFKNFLIFCSLTLATTTLVAFNYDNFNESKFLRSIDIYNIETIKDVTGQYQIERSFPVKIIDNNFDDSLLTNQILSFNGYSSQGKILLKCKNISDFKIFINGTELKINNFNNDDWNIIDISSITINGNNKIQVSNINVSPNNTLYIKIPYPTLIDNTKQYQQNDNFKLIDQIINAEIENGFTSAQLVIVKDGKIIKQSSYGNINSYNQDGTILENKIPVTNETLYDLASNTKMYATNYAIQKLVSEGKLNINQKVSDIFPDFRDKENDKIKGKDNLTIKEILQHQAGFPADPQYHNNNYDTTSNKLSNTVGNKLFTQNRDEMLNMVINTPLEYEPGTKTKYSDVDYILLGFIVEKISNQNLDEYMKENYYNPLNLKHITFNPLENGFNKNQIAATELNGNTRDGIIDFKNIRKYTIQGEVHDEKAFYSMNGISGHAGLFSNATDLAVLTQIILNDGGYGEHKFFDANTMDNFIKPKDENATYGLGWRRNGTNLYSWAFSPLADKSTIGHTGWVGTLTVIDPINDMSIILLTNSKNSPVLDKTKNPNDFLGNHYLTSGYGLISTLSFDSIENSNKIANDSKLIDMINSKYDLIQSNENYQTIPDKLSLKALTDVLNIRKTDSKIIQDFISTNKYKLIDEFLKQ